MRSGALAPSHWPTMLPIESPHQLGPPDAKPVHDRERIASELRHAVRALRDAGAAMSAPVVAHQAEVLRKRLDLRVPHAVIGAERIAQHEERARVPDLRPRR